MEILLLAMQGVSTTYDAAGSETTTNDGQLIQITDRPGRLLPSKNHYPNDCRSSVLPSSPAYSILSLRISMQVLRAEMNPSVVYCTLLAVQMRPCIYIPPVGLYIVSST